MQVSSAFSQLLNLHNLTEEIGNAQQERAIRMGEVSFHFPLHTRGYERQSMKVWWMCGEPTDV